MQQLKELLIALLNFLGLAVWVEVKTDSPNCTYYFGPFLTQKEASLEQEGYVADLKSEKAQISQIMIKRLRPQNLTVVEGSESSQSYGKMPSFKRPSVLS